MMHKQMEAMPQEVEPDHCIDAEKQVELKAAIALASNLLGLGGDSEITAAECPKGTLQKLGLEEQEQEPK